LRPPLQRVSAFAGFDLAVFGLDLVAVLRAECSDSGLLRVQAKTAPTLLGFGNADVTWSSSPNIRRSF
jgi:hypothetical protein